MGEEIIELKVQSSGENKEVGTFTVNFQVSEDGYIWIGPYTKVKADVFFDALAEFVSLERIKELEAKGFCVGDIQDFLELTPKEVEEIGIIG